MLRQNAFQSLSIAVLSMQIYVLCCEKNRRVLLAFCKKIVWLQQQRGEDQNVTLWKIRKIFIPSRLPR
jgi:hypothetical protein